MKKWKLNLKNKRKKGAVKLLFYDHNLFSKKTYITLYMKLLKPHIQNKLYSSVIISVSSSTDSRTN